MTLTNRHNNHRQHGREKHDSRIKQTRAYILDKNLTGQLNNQKWLRIFDWLQKNHNSFTVTTLLHPGKRTCTFIRELESNSILIDDSGQFIDFIEISKLTMVNSQSLIAFLDQLNIEYLADDKTLVVVGYR